MWNRRKMTPHCHTWHLVLLKNVHQWADLQRGKETAVRRENSTVIRREDLRDLLVWYLKAEKLDVLYGSNSHWLCRDLISHMNVSPFATVWVRVNVSISAVSALTLQVCFPGARLERRWEWEENKGEEVVPRSNKNETLKKCFFMFYLFVRLFGCNLCQLTLLKYVSYVLPLRYYAWARTVLINYLSLIKFEWALLRKSQTCSKLIFKHLFTCFTFCSCRAVRLSTCRPSGCFGLDLSPLGPSDDEAV